MRFLNDSGFIILIHLWKRVACLMEILGNLIPPDWEVLLKSSSHVGSVRSWLTHDVVEAFIWSFPSRSLNTQEGCESERNWKSKHHSVSHILDNWSHKWEAKSPSYKRVCHELSRKFLELPVIKLLHSKHLIVSEIVIIDVS